MYFLFLDRGVGKEKERERNISVWLPLVCPKWGSDQRPFGLQASSRAPEPHRPGHCHCLFGSSHPSGWGGKRCLIVVGVCVFLVTNVTEYLFVSLWTICTSLERCLSRPFACFSLGLFVLLFLSCKFLRYSILHTSFLSGV